MLVSKVLTFMMQDALHLKQGLVSRAHSFTQGDVIRRVRGGMPQDPWLEKPPSAPPPFFSHARPSLPTLAPRSATPSTGELVRRVPRTETSAPHWNLGHRRRCPPLGWGNRA
jgi:hypothetical protein